MFRQPSQPYCEQDLVQEEQPGKQGRSEHKAIGPGRNQSMQRPEAVSGSSACMDTACIMHYCRMEAAEVLPEAALVGVSTAAGWK